MDGSSPLPQTLPAPPSAPIPSGRQLPPCLVLIAGGAATGKSRLAQELTRRVANAVLLDKDRLFGVWVDRLLRAAHAAVDRDSRYYWEEVRPLEYLALERAAYDHLELGKVVVVDAPLRPELNDPAWVKRVRRECTARGAGFLAVWTLVSPETARRRMVARHEPRDRWKLAHWDEFIRRQPYQLPAGATLTLSNEDGDPQELTLTRILAALAAEAAGLEETRS